MTKSKLPLIEQVAEDDIDFDATRLEKAKKEKV